MADPQLYKSRYLVPNTDITRDGEYLQCQHNGTIYRNPTTFGADLNLIETRGNALVLVNSILLAFVILVVLLRLYTRIVVKKWFGSDDAFIALALVSTIGLTTVVLLANKDYGWDRHVYDIHFTKIATTGKIAMAAKVMFVAAATFTRLSLFCFYYRLVKDSAKRTFVLVIHANVAFSVAVFIAFIFLAIFQCTPVRNYWIFEAPADSCVDEGASTMAAGIINCVADLMCTLLPIPMVAKLQMPRRQRIGVVILFSIGFIVTIAGVVRTYFIYRSLVTSYDQTWEAYPLWICAAIEIDLGVICASAPVLRPLLSKIPFIISSFSKDSKKERSLIKSSKGSSSRDSKSNGPSGIPLRHTRNSKSHSGLNSKIISEPIKEEAGTDDETVIDDVEKGIVSVRSSIGGSEAAILGSEEEQYILDPRDNWRRMSTAKEKSNVRGVRIATPEQYGGRVSQVSTRSSDAVGVAK